MRTRLIWTIKDSYDDYLESLEDLLDEGEEVEDSVYYINYKTYKEAVQDFFFELCLLIIREKLIFKIPNRLGYIGIKKDKTTSKKRKPNFKLYNEKNIVASHTNIHTNGWYFFYHWDKHSTRYTRFKNMTVYKFMPNRGNDRKIGKRGLSEWIQQCSKDPKKKTYDAPIIYKRGN